MVCVSQSNTAVSSPCTMMTPVCDTGQDDVVSLQQQQNLHLADEVDHLRCSFSTVTGFYCAVLY